MLGKLHSRIIVRDVDTAERVAIELVRNVLVARPGANLLVVGVSRWSQLQEFLMDEAVRFGSRTDPSEGHWDICIIGECLKFVVDDIVDLVVELPAVRASVSAKRKVTLDVGHPTGEVLIVPGTAHKINGAHSLTAEAFGRLKKAEQIATQRDVRVLILSGWNGWDEGSRSEAAQMVDAWRGPPIPIILDEAARTTAENALWSAVLATALGDVRRVRMLTSWVSALRLGIATFAAFRRTEIAVRMSVVWGSAQAASWRPAFVGLIHLRRHLRAGRALIAHGPCNKESTP